MSRLVAAATVVLLSLAVARGARVLAPLGEPTNRRASWSSTWSR